MGLGAPKSLQECPPGPRTITSKRRLPKASATIVSAPAPSSTRLYAIASFHRGVEKMCRMPRRSPSPSSPTLPMNTNGKAWRMRTDRNSEAIAQHRRHSRSVVGDARPVNAASLLANVEWSIGRKHRIDVRGERNIAPPKPRMGAEDIADIVDANIVQPNLAKALLQPSGARGLAKRGRPNPCHFHLPLQ